MKPPLLALSTLAFIRVIRGLNVFGCGGAAPRNPWLKLFCDKRSTSGAGIGAIDSYKIGPSIAMVLFQSRRVIGHWATVSAVTGWEQAR